MKVLDRTHIQTEVYERGAGYTLASGSGCCAAAAAATVWPYGSEMIVQMPGGTLELEIPEDGNVLMTGDVGYVGSISWEIILQSSFGRLTNKKTAFIVFYRYRQKGGVSHQIPALIHFTGIGKGFCHPGRGWLNHEQIQQRGYPQDRPGGGCGVYLPAVYGSVWNNEVCDHYSRTGGKSPWTTDACLTVLLLRAM